MAGNRGLTDLKHAGVVAVVTVFVHDRDVDVDDVAVFKNLLFARNPVTDHVVGGNAGRGRIGNAALGGVVEARGLAFEFVHRVLKHEFIESQRRDACLDVRGNEV